MPYFRSNGRQSVKGRWTSHSWQLQNGRFKVRKHTCLPNQPETHPRPPPLGAAFTRRSARCICVFISSFDAAPAPSASPDALSREGRCVALACHAVSDPLEELRGTRMARPKPILSARSAAACWCLCSLGSDCLSPTSGPIDRLQSGRVSACPQLPAAVGGAVRAVGLPVVTSSIAFASESAVCVSSAYEPPDAAGSCGWREHGARNGRVRAGGSEGGRRWRIG